jgi:hypothetical protein
MQSIGRHWPSRREWSEEGDATIAEFFKRNGYQTYLLSWGLFLRRCRLFTHGCRSSTRLMLAALMFVIAPLQAAEVLSAHQFSIVLGTGAARRGLQSFGQLDGSCRHFRGGAPHRTFARLQDHEDR